MTLYLKWPLTPISDKLTMRYRCFSILISVQFWHCLLVSVAHGTVLNGHATLLMEGQLKSRLVEWVSSELIEA